MSEGTTSLSATRTWEFVALFALCCFAGLSLYAERGMLYFDEVINAAKAEEGLVFDYALRPLYYVMNRLAWATIGEDVASLRLLVLVLYGVTVFLVFRTGWVLAGRFCAWAAALGVVLSETVLVHGIRGMPHLPAGALLAVSLFLLVRSESSRSARRVAWWYGVASGTAALAAVACHPTTIPFAVAVGAWALLGLVRRAARQRRLLVPLRDPRGGLLLGLTVSGASFLLVMMLKGQGSYVASLVRGVEVVQTENSYHFNHEPWSFYLERVSLDPPLLVLVVLAGVGGLPLALLATRGGSAKRPAADRLRRLALLVWVSGFSLVAISAVSWKFDRVLVSFVPLFAVTLAAIAASGLEHLARQTTLRAGVAAGALALVALTGVVSANGAREKILRISVPQPRNEHYRLTQILQSLVTQDRLAYLGSGSDFTRLGITASAADKRLVYIRHRGEVSASWRSRLESELLEKQVEFVLVNFPEEAATRHDARWWAEEFESSQLDEVYQNRHRFELWRFRPHIAPTGLLRLLARIPPGTQIGVLGQPSEIGRRRAAWVDHLLEASRVRDYRLWLSKNPRVQFGYVERKKLPYVLLVSTPVVAHREHVEGFRRLMIDAGGRRMATDPRTSAELWEIEH